MITLDAYILKLKRQKSGIISEDIPLARASLTAHQQASRRIFAENLDVNKALFTYKPKTKRKRKGAYQADWARTREKKGRQIGKVDLTFTGDFASDYMNSEGGAIAPLRISTHKYITGFFSRGKKGISHADLAGVFEDIYYGTDIFILSEEERKIFYKTARIELLDYLSR